MFDHISFVPESAAADVASKWHFARVNALMNGESCGITEGFLAYVASKRFLASVNSHVTFQTLFNMKFPLTIVTFELRRSIGMDNLLMRFQCTRQGESTLALIACKLFDSCMLDHVHRQLIFNQETFLANIALIPFFAGVNFSRVQHAFVGGAKLLAAFGADERLDASVLRNMNLELTIVLEFFVTK